MGIERLKEFWPEWKACGVLGAGAFGKVYKAVNDTAGFHVYSAIKVLSIPSNDAELDSLKSEGMTEQEIRNYFKSIADDFINEIKLMNTLKGAVNIVSVEDFIVAEKRGSIGWDIFIRMELLTSFKEYLAARTPTEADIVKLGIDIASALEVCEEKKIIHRDIKPANIFIDDYGNFKLGDFGIAKELEKTTCAVSSKGTFSYMAPEVAHGLRYDRSVDIYSLGLVLYNLLNNNRPPLVDTGKSDISYNERREANEKRLSGKPLPPPCNASQKLADIILVACAYEPSKRFKSASALKAALKTYQSGEKSSMPIKAREHKKKRAGLIVASALMLAFSITVAAVFPLLVNKSKNNQEKDVYNYLPNAQTKELPVDTEENKQSNETETNVAPEEPVIIIPPNVNIGNIVELGSYEQDDDFSNGSEAMYWRVIAKEGNRALLITDKAIDCKQYNAENASVTWEDCDLRKWLNGEFYESVFGTEEKAIIETSYLSNSGNAEKGVAGGNDTYDKVFLLSIDEVNRYLLTEGDKWCLPTNYAISNGAYVSDTYDGSCWWWLRSPGYVLTGAAVVSTYGTVNSTGRYVNGSDNCVRPAIWVSLEDQ